MFKLCIHVYLEVIAWKYVQAWPACMIITTNCSQMVVFYSQGSPQILALRSPSTFRVAVLFCWTTTRFLML